MEIKEGAEGPVDRVAKGSDIDSCFKLLEDLPLKGVVEQTSESPHDKGTSESESPRKKGTMRMSWETATKTVIEKVVKLRLESDHDYRGLETKSSDVLVSSYAKSGAEVVRVIVVTMLRFTNRPRAPSITPAAQPEKHRLESLDPEGYTALPEPKILYTNLRYNSLPQGFKGKIIYVIRNPKSAAVELYNSRYINQDKISFKEFAGSFLDIENSPLHFKSHVYQYINNEQDLKILCVKFEDIEKKPGPLFNTISCFLGLRGLTNREGLEILRRIDLAQTRGKLIGKSMANWNFVAQSIKSENFLDYFDSELNAKFDKQLKTDWKMVQTAEC